MPTSTKLPVSSSPRTWLTRMVAVLGTAGLMVSVVNAPTAVAASVTTAAFTGGSGTVSVGGSLYAKQGGVVTLTLTTSSDTKCVDVAGALTDHAQSSTAKSTWTFTSTAPSGNGVRAVTATASPGFNPQNKCTGNSGSAQASYTLDNAGPVVTGALSPSPNAAGWNKSGVSVAWSAADVGSGVASGPAPATDGVNADTAGVVKTSTAADRLGNVGSGSVTVKVDKDDPGLLISYPGPNSLGWYNRNVEFTVSGCSDTLSGIKTCPGSAVLSNEGANQSVSLTAVDNADNDATWSESGINIDKTAPSLTGAPTTSPNGNGWYNDAVTIAWSCSDSLSGINGGCPASSTIAGEGTALTATRFVSDKASNATSATSAPVQIDRTAPTTAISGASNSWTNGNINVVLSPSDNLSGVGSTSYSVDGGPQQTGTDFTLSSEGDHAVTFSSTDRAGNVETLKTAHIKIDKTAPTIGHTFAPLDYADSAWTNEDVTVSFTCSDTGSGVVSCSPPVTKSDEGAGQQVVGTARDAAGNTSTDTATVSIDKTKPTITATPDRAANAAGWYDDDVTVSFGCSDALSGVVECPLATTLGAGAGQSATGTTRDAAGNAATAGVTGVNVDKTAPVLTASYPGGWHNGDVTVDWTCSDALSGVSPAGEPSDEILLGEGDNLSSAATCRDNAGNTTTQTVSGVKIDRHAPSTTADVPDALPSGWYAGPVDVTLTSFDGLSGVDTTYYTVDGGPAQPYAGAFSFGQKGVHTISYWSEDRAGNVEGAVGNEITLKIDGIAPTTSVVNPISPASGWFVTSGIPVAFAASDAESGIAATYYRIDGGPRQTYGEQFTADLSTGVHTISYWSEDVAGNAEDVHETEVKVDTLAPTITATRTPSANAFGWNNTDVKVSFACSDADSGVDGIAGCGPDATVSSEGADQSVQGDTQDVAGNTSTTTVDHVNIDKTAPLLTGAATTDANAAGWYNSDVLIRWTGADGLSHIDPATQPEDSTIGGEGSNLGASASIFDQAGNEGFGSVYGIKIDRTAPVITGSPTSSPNAAGWYRDQVTVDFQCTDALSGVAFCPTSQVVAGDGANQSVTSASATDKAGNDSAATTVGGINIDGSAPSTTANNQCTKVNGWCTGSTATVVLTSVDQPGLSGVKEIHYRIDGGSEQVAAGATKTVSVPLDGSGAGTVRYWAVDKAGNVETANSVALQWDNIAPTVTHTVSPAPNANDWNNSDVTVTFTAKDDDAGSGVAQVTGPVTVATETGGRLVTGSATDVAGNVGTDSVTVRLDKTAPNINGAIVSGVLGNNGWYVGPVKVHFTCSDALSGVATCPDDVTLTDNGTNTATGTATDKAGNSASASVPGIRVDQEPPTITGVNVAGGFYTLGAVPDASCTATDSYSGPESCQVTVSGGGANGVGQFSYIAKATDKAGNTRTQTGTYQVVYRFDGFLQPINDTAHQVGSSTSVFKAGSTIPAKLQLKRADGTVVQAATAPVWLTPVKGGAMSLPVDETSYAASGDSGSVFKYDTTSQQYLYNWKTASGGGNYWRMGVRLDDGQTYFVNIGLR